MVKIVLIKPHKFDETFLFLSMNQIGVMLMENETILNSREISQNDHMEDIIGHLEMPTIKDPGLIGDTLKIFYDKDFTYKILFVEGTLKSESEYNLLASILHPEGKKVYYNTVIVKLNKDNEFVDLTREEVIKLIDKRRNHIGIQVGSNIKEVEMDNYWTLKNGESLRNFNKKVVSHSGYFLIILTDNTNYELTNSNNKKYIFAFVDKCKKVMCDLTLDEYKLIIKVDNRDEIDIDNPYHYCLEINSKLV